MAENVRVTGEVVEVLQTEYDFFQNGTNERVQGISKKIKIQTGRASIIEVKIPRQMQGALPSEGTMVDLEVEPRASNGRVSLSVVGDYKPWVPPHLAGNK